MKPLGKKKSRSHVVGKRPRRKDSVGHQDCAICHDDSKLEASGKARERRIVAKDVEITINGVKFSGFKPV